MTKTVCDIDGKSPAQAFKLGTNTNTYVSVDLCDSCVANMVNYIRDLITVDNMEPVTKQKPVDSKP